MLWYDDVVSLCMLKMFREFISKPLKINLEFKKGSSLINGKKLFPDYRKGDK